MKVILQQDVRGQGKKGGNHLVFHGVSPFGQDAPVGAAPRCFFFPQKEKSALYLVKDRFQTICGTTLLDRLAKTRQPALSEVPTHPQPITQALRLG